MNSLLFILQSMAGALLLLIPGALTARLLTPPRAAAETSVTQPLARGALVALAWAFGVVPSAAFFLCLATGARMSWPLLGIASAINSAVVLWILWRRQREASSPARLLAFRPTRAQAALMVTVGLVGAAYFVKYDNRSHASESCIYRTAYAAAGLVAPGSELRADVDLLRNNVQDARLGNTAVLSAALVLFEGFGFRVLYGVCGLMMALGGYLLGSWMGGRARWGYLALALLPLNPYVASIPQLDENLLALSFSVSVLPFVTAGRGFAAAGAFFGLAVTMRHVMIPALPALLLLAWRGEGRTGRWRGVGLALAGFGALTAMEALHHHLALGSMLRFESNAQFPAFPYSLAGLEFSYHGLFNWPLHEQLVRTPHNPFPTSLMFALYLADYLGLVILAAMILGFVWLWRTSPGKAAFWALWSLVIAAGLSLQEGWDAYNKMWVPVILFPSFVAWTVAGAAAVVRRPRYGLPALAALILCCHLTIGLLKDTRAPADTRQACVESGGAAEDPRRLEADARRLTDVGLLPDVGRLGLNGPFLAVRKISGILADLGNPGVVTRPRPWGWFPREAPPPGAPVTVQIDLSADPHGRRDMLSISQSPPHLDLCGDDSTWARVHGVKVPWDSRPLTLHAGRSRHLTAVVAFYDGVLPARSCPAPPEPRQERLAVQRCWALHTLLGAPERCAASREVKHTRPVIRIRVPSGGLSLSVEKSVGPDRLILWKGLVTSRGVTLSASFEPWDN